MKTNQYSWPQKRRTSLGTPERAAKSKQSRSAKPSLSQPLLTQKSILMWKRWSGTFWLILYFLLNLSLTLYNKMVLNHFPFPYTLTAIHALCGTIGTFLFLHWTPILNFVKHRVRFLVSIDDSTRVSLRAGGPLTSRDNGGARDSLMPGIPKLHGKEVIVLLLYSVLYSVNIVVSNASLRLVTVPFHQVVRALTPLFTVLLSIVLLGKYSSRAKLVTLIPVVAGVGFATYGDYYFTPRGFFLTLLGTVLAALKTITTNLLQSRPSPMPKIDLYAPLSPVTLKIPTSQPHARQEQLSEKAESHLENPLIKDSDYTPAGFNFPTTPFLSLQDQASVLVSELDEETPTSPSFASSVQPDLFHLSHTRFHSASPAFLISDTPTLQRLRKAMVELLDLPRLTLSPIQLLYLLSPIAFIQCTLLAHYSGELQLVNIHLSRVAHEYMRRNADADSLTVATGFGRVRELVGLGGSLRLWLMLNGVLAFFLNVVSFNANRKVGALAMTVSANVKQVLTVLCSIAMFNLQVTTMNGLGICLTIVGGAWYAAVELDEKKNTIK